MRRPTAFILFSMALCAFRPARASEFADWAAQMDTSAPKYNSAGCLAARTAAINYSDNIGGRVALGAVLGVTLGIVGLPIAAEGDASQARQAQSVVDNLIAQCGNEALVPAFRKRAEDGNAMFQAWMGQAYYRGWGVKRDYGESARWFGLAASQGQSAAENNLGEMYQDGLGVTQDKQKAIDLYKKAYSDGSRNAAFNLGQAYEKGDGIAQDNDEALHYYRWGAIRGSGGAEFALGRFFRDGIVVRQSDLEAYEWFATADANGEVSAGPQREALQAKLNESQVRTASKNIQQCIASNYDICKY